MAPRSRAVQPTLTADKENDVVPVKATKSRKAAKNVESKPLEEISDLCAKLNVLRLEVQTKESQIANQNKIIEENQKLLATTKSENEKLMDRVKKLEKHKSFKPSIVSCYFPVEKCLTSSLQGLWSFRALTKTLIRLESREAILGNQNNQRLHICYGPMKNDLRYDLSPTSYQAMKLMKVITGCSKQSRGKSCWDP